MAYIDPDVRVRTFAVGAKNIEPNALHHFEFEIYKALAKPMKRVATIEKSQVEKR